MRRCPKCGALVSDEAKFCTYCGEPLDAKSVEEYDPDHFDWDDDTKPLENDEEDYDFNDVSVSKWDEPSEMETTKKEVSPRTLEKVRIALLIILIALVAGFGGFYFYSNQNVVTTKTHTTTGGSKSSTPATVGSDEGSSSSSTNSDTDSSSDTSSSTGSDTTSNSDTSSSKSTKQGTDSTSEDESGYTKSTASDGSTYVNEALKKDANGEYGNDDTSDAETYDGDVLPNSSRDKLSDSDLKGMSNSQIQTAINEIYARNGYKFTKVPSMQEKSYYTGEYSDMSDAEARMNSTEKFNVDYLACYKKHH